MPPLQAAARFDELARDMPERLRTPLWRAIMLRSDWCPKNLEAGQMAELECFCACCLPDEPEAGSPRWAPPLGVVYAYPDYRYHAHPKLTTDPRVEKVVHAYLTRMGILPPAFEEPMYERDVAVLDPVMSVPGRVRMDLNGPVTREQLLAAVSDSSRCRTLLLCMCGHGRSPDGALLTSDRRVVSLDDVGACLSRAGFRGTVVVLVNTCHAEGDGPIPRGLGDQVGFRWVVMYSCGSDAQKPSHAGHVVRLMAALARERPTYGELQARSDRLWVETRDPDQPAALWRGPPTLRMRGVDPAARFLD